VTDAHALSQDLLAVFCDPVGQPLLPELAVAGEPLSALTPQAFLARGPRHMSLPSALEARYYGLTAMAEAWAGAVRTWHETQSGLRPASVSAAAEASLYAELAAQWPVAAAQLGGSGVLEEFRHALLQSESFRYTFDGVVARVAEIAERMLRGQEVLSATMTPGLPLTPIQTAPEDEPVDRIVAFMRGTDLLVAVAVGDRATGACGWSLPPDAEGHWHDELTGRAYELPDRASLAGILGPDGRAVLARAR